MSDDATEPPEEDDAADPTDHGAIGVGMGGSCPVCRAPVDLGQEFCLECGSPIRFTPRQRRQQRTQVAAAAPVPPPRRGGFPWIPFLVVLALIGGGVAFALVGDDGKKGNSGKGASTDTPLPSITNSVPTDTSSTTTLEACDPTRPIDGSGSEGDGEDGGSEDTSTDGETSSQSADATSTSGSLDTEQTIPHLLDGSGTDPGTGEGGDDGDPFDDADVPSTTSSDGSGEGGSGATVTVDENGNLCPSSGSTDTTDQGGLPTDPLGTGGDQGALDPGTTSRTTPSTSTRTATSTTSTTKPSTTTTTSTDGTWPSGRTGWTVVVAGYETEARASQRAADVQEDGFTDGGVLFSSDYTSLCPGFYVVFSGTFDTRAGAERRSAELRAKDYAGMYVREVRTDGAAATGCRTSPPG